MIKLITAKLSILFLLIAITTCYYERETDQLKACFIRNLDIWTMNIDGSDQKQITFTNDNGYPSWSPDGEKIVFHSERSNPGVYNIYIINADGTGLKKITYSTSPDTNLYPTWSSDGSKIYFNGRRSGTEYIFIADSDGIILNSYSFASPPVYLSVSPDERFIYYNLSSVAYKKLISTGSFSQLIFGSSLTSISPDGKTLAYSDTTSISFYDINTNTNYNSFSGDQPCWTPDGKSIVYKSTLTNDIWSINIDGTNQRPLTTSGDCYYPCVQGKPR